MEYKKNRKKRAINSRSRRKIKFQKQKKRALFLKRFFIIFFIIALLCAAVYGVYFLLSKAFCVKEIVVEGNALYSDTEILHTAEIKQGDSLIFLDSSKSAKKIYETYPYIEKVNIYRQFPNKVKISLETAMPKTAIYKDDAFYIISENDKLLNVVSEIPSEVMEIKGLDFEIQNNTQVVYKNKDLYKLKSEIQNEFDSVDLKSISLIDITDVNNIRATYDGRINIIIGNADDLKYKMVTVKEIIVNKINQQEKGTLDLTDLSEENKSYFTPDV